MNTARVYKFENPEHKYILAPEAKEKLKDYPIRTRFIFDKLLYRCGTKNYCFPKIETICKDLGLDFKNNVRNVRRVLKKLEEDGMIQRTAEIGRHGGVIHNIYTLTCLTVDNKGFETPPSGSDRPLPSGSAEPPINKLNKINKPLNPPLEGGEKKVISLEEVRGEVVGRTDTSQPSNDKRKRISFPAKEELSDKTIWLIKAEGFSDFQINLGLLKCKNHYAGRYETMERWQGRIHNWFITSAERKAKQPGFGKKYDQYENKLDKILAEIV